MGAVDVMLTEGCVGLGDADEGDLGVGWKVVEEALYVAVDETDDGYADRRSCLGEGDGWDEAGDEDCGREKEFGESHGCGDKCSSLH